MSAFVTVTDSQRQLISIKETLLFPLMAADVSGNGRLDPSVSFGGSLMHHGVGVG